MDGPRHEVLSRTAFAQEQHGRTSNGRHATDEGPDLLNLGVLPEDRLYRVLPAPRLLERRAGLEQRPVGQRPREER